MKHLLFAKKHIPAYRPCRVIIGQPDVPEEILFAPMPGQPHYFQRLHPAGQVHIGI